MTDQGYWFKVHGNDCEVYGSGMAKTEAFIIDIGKEVCCKMKKKILAAVCLLGIAFALTGCSLLPDSCLPDPPDFSDLGIKTP